jgi:hypothetical protein
LRALYAECKRRSAVRAVARAKTFRGSFADWAVSGLAKGLSLIVASGRAKSRVGGAAHATAAACVAMLAACSVGSLGLANRACPCVEGYTCDGATNRCVPVVLVGTGGDAGADAGDAAGGGTDGSLAGDTPSTSDGPAPSCSTPLQVCGSTCVALESDPKNCGACGHDCLGGACLSGACLAFVFATATLAADSLASDGANLYWTDGSSPGFIETCSATGCAGAPTSLAVVGGTPTAIAADGARVYWVDTLEGTVNQCAVGGCNGQPTILASGQSQPGAIAVDATTVYWTALQGTSLVVGQVLACPIGGSCASPSTLVANVAYPSGIAVDATSVYFETGTGLSRCARGGCGGTATVVASGTASSSVGVIALGGMGAYWTGQAGLLECNVAGCGTPSKFASMAAGVAADGAFVYWTQSSGVGQVMKCPLAGCGAEPTTLASNLNGPSSLAIDETAIYWIDGSTIYKLAK